MAVVDKTFSEVIAALVNAATENKVQLINGKCTWAKLKTGDEGNELLNGLDTEEIADTFSRDGTSKQYAEALDTEKSYRESLAAKLQGDFLSAVERDTRMRYRNNVPMFHHAAARQATHGLGVGSVEAIKKYVTHTLDAGDDEASTEAQQVNDEQNNTADTGGNGTPSGANKSPNAAGYDPQLWETAVRDSADPVDRGIYDAYNGIDVPQQSIPEISAAFGIPPSAVNDSLKRLNDKVAAGPGDDFDCDLGVI